MEAQINRSRSIICDELLFDEFAYFIRLTADTLAFNGGVRSIDKPRFKPEVWETGFFYDLFTEFSTYT